MENQFKNDRVSDKKKSATAPGAFSPLNRGKNRSVSSTRLTKRTSRGITSQLSQPWVLGLILIFAVILSYQPVWYAGYLWDDAEHVTENPCIVGPLGLKEIWTTSAGMSYPLALTVFWLEHALWGLQPLPYHLINVAEHAVSAVLLWRVLLSLRVPGAWFGAALWALHPLQVESMVWITEMKNTQSGVFYLLTILFFVKWIRNEEPRGWAYPLMLLFAAMAITSKFSTVVLPLVLCLCSWWVEGRWQWRRLLKLAPIFAMAAIASAVILVPGVQAAPDGSVSAGSWPERLIIAGRAFWFYLGKLLWPHSLMAIYPRWEIDSGEWFNYLPLLVAGIIWIVFWCYRKTWARAWFFALAYYLVVILPFLGLIDQSFWQYSFVEDHLQYLAGMGPLALIGAGLAKLGDSVLPGKHGLQSVLGVALLLILGTVSWQRAVVYGSGEALWTDTLSKNPGSWTAHHNLGTILLHSGRTNEAFAQFQQALEINPDYPVARNNLGFILLQRGKVDEAIAQFQKVQKMNPGYEAAYNSLGGAFMLKGQLDRAIDQFQKALEINPYDTNARYNLGIIYLQQKRWNEAVDQFQKCLEINPNDSEAQKNLIKAQEMLR